MIRVVVVVEGGLGGWGGVSTASQEEDERTLKNSLFNHRLKFTLPPHLFLQSIRFSGLISPLHPSRPHPLLPPHHQRDTAFPVARFQRQLPHYHLVTFFFFFF